MAQKVTGIIKLQINAVLTQSGAYRGGSGSLSGVDLKLDNTGDFLCHYKHLLNKMW